MHIDLGRFSSTTEDTAEALIGTRYVTLNNSKQDKSYVRQTLGYRMLDVAGLPHSRCNYARVFVNGTPIGEGLGGELFPGVFVNAEPIMKRYIERHFNGNMNGNLYEIEHTDDFTEDRLPFIGVEDLSEFDDKADLKFACRHIKANGLAGADEMLDMDQYLKVYAMEFLLKHWDGYANNTNNTYLYNDVTAVESPGVGNIKFKMIPWGVDQILKPRRILQAGSHGDRRAARPQRRGATKTVDGSDSRLPQDVVQPRAAADRLEALDRPDAESPNGTRRAERCGGDRHRQAAVATRANRPPTFSPACPSPTDPVYILKHDTSQLSSCQQYRVDSTRRGSAPVDFEVYHQQLFDNNHPTDLWVLNDLGTGKSFTNQAFNRNLHASDTQVTPAGHKYLYTCAPEQRRACRGVHDRARTGSRHRSRQPARPFRVHRLLQHRQRADHRDGEIRKRPHAGGQAAGPPGIARLQPLLLLITLLDIRRRRIRRGRRQ